MKADKKREKQAGKVFNSIDKDYKSLALFALFEVLADKVKEIGNELKHRTKNRKVKATKNQKD